METFADVIDRFPSAEALGALIGKKGVTVRQWRYRNSIPVGHWVDVAQAAQESGFDDITVDALCRIATSDAHRERAAS